MDQKQTKKSDIGQKKEKGKKKEEKQSPTSTTVVLKVDMHCDGCASKIVKCVRGFEGVESLKVETETGKLTVTGNVDPVKLRDNLSRKMKKNVGIVSSLPNKDKDKDKENKSNNNNKSDDKKPKESAMTTTVLKVPLHCPCQGCFNKLHKAVLKSKGVYEVAIDNEKETVTVKGTMDVKALVEYLSGKFKRKVEVVPPKKEKEKGKEKEKEKEGEKEGEKGGHVASKKKKKGGGDGSGGGGGDKDKDDEGGRDDGKGKKEESIIDYTPPTNIYGDFSNYMVQYHPASHMFSDENPYACHIM